MNIPAKDMLLLQIKLKIEPAVQRAFKEGAEDRIYSDVELDEFKTLHIEADPKKGSFSMSAPRVSIRGKLDKNFNIHSCEPKALLGSTDKDFQYILDRLQGKVPEFQKKQKSTEPKGSSDFSGPLPGQ